MANITVVGLGPGPVELLTAEARQVLASTNELYLRTRHNPFVSTLSERIVVRDFDELIAGAAPSGSPDRVFAERIVSLGERAEGVVYAVPGSPLDANRSVREILRCADERRVPVRLVAGISLFDAAVQRLGLDPWQRKLIVLDAALIVERIERDEEEERHLYGGEGRVVDPTVPAMVFWFGGQESIPALTEALRAIYPSDHPVSVIHLGRETAQESVWSGTLDCLPVGLGEPVACVYLPPVDRLSDLAGFDTLRYIVARLRAPDGCPWDREQTHQSMKKHFIEETYEAIAALDEDDWAKFAEELGDVVLQVVMHSQLAHEDGRFNLDDVLRAVNGKLIRRHPHVFGDVRVASSADVLRNWEKIKRSESGVTKSSFASIPQSMPALMRADAVQSRAVRYGWTPPTNLPSMADLDAVARTSSEATRRALGRALFGLVALARRADVDPEEALRLATTAFAERLEEVLVVLHRRDPAFDALGPDERAALIAQALSSAPEDPPIPSEASRASQ